MLVSAKQISRGEGVGATEDEALALEPPRTFFQPYNRQLGEPLDYDIAENWQPVGIDARAGDTGPGFDARRDVASVITRSQKRREGRGSRR